MKSQYFSKIFIRFEIVLDKSLKQNDHIALKVNVESE